MLPSSGYFQTLNCPFYDSGLCDRPYCHYRHVKKESVTTKDSVLIANSLSNEPGNAFLGIGDDQNILQQLVSEAVKKALQSTELSSVEGDLKPSQSSGTNSEVSTKLVEKVIEGLKPLVAPPVATSSSVPSYKPTPIAELRKRHIPVPYTPKDTKTILVKRQLSCDGSSQFVKAKSTTAKYREEYVPGIFGKAIGNSEVQTYKPFASPSYGEVQYSPSDIGIKSEILYTPSDKSSLPSKAADYVPSGLSDSFLPDTFYKPTTRGESPIQEPQYQPDVGIGSGATVSYTPSKLDGLEEVKDSIDCKETLGLGGVNLSTNSSVLTSEGLNTLKTLANESSKTCEEKSGGREKLDSLSEGEQSISKESAKESDSLVNGVHGLKRDSKEKEKVKSSQSKHSSHHDSRDQKDSKKRRDSKSDRNLKGGKDVKDQKSTEEQKDSKEKKDVKDPKDSKDQMCSEDTKNGKYTKNSKVSKDSKDAREKLHKNHKDDKDLKEKRKMKDSDDQHSQSKHRNLENREKCEGERKEKNHATESKHKTEGSHKSCKDVKSIEEKNHRHSNSRSHLIEKSKTKHKSDSHSSEKKDKDGELSCRKVKSDVSHSSHKNSHGEKRSSSEVPNVRKKKCEESHSSRDNKHSERETVSKSCKSEAKRKRNGGNSFEEMEQLLKEQIQEREAIDDGSFGDSDTDEDIRTQECLRIFNSYKPNEAMVTEEKHKKRKLEESEQTQAVAPPLGKRRLAHDGALNLPKKPALTPKAIFNPAQAMIKRFAKMREEQEKAASLAGSILPQPQPVQPKSTIGSGRVRIAHVPNVSKLLDAKKNISAAVQIGKLEPTVSQTAPKGLPRMAHMPREMLSKHPFIYPDDRSKIPTNVRQKYLNLIFEELLKKIDDVEECCVKSLKEEMQCYERSTSRNLYVNLAIISIRRLRNMDVSSYEKEETPGGSKHTVYHENIIGGKAKAKGEWSIIPPKKGPDCVDENAAYQMLQKYVLSEEELTQNGYPRPHPTEKGRAVMMETMFRSKTKSKSYYERICDRCGKDYLVNDQGLSRSEEQCVYHWGRPYKTRGIGGLETRYSCCQGESRSEGCTVWNCHVSDMFDPDNQRGFVQLIEKPNATSDQIFSLDCEMCYTTDGMELLRVTVINFNGVTVYDTLVKPEKPVLDYATRFSGITEDDMKTVSKTLLDVQATLLTLFHKKTILIGHSLDSDLKALKLIHDMVIDTSMVFPHRRGPPFKRALKTLMAEYLQKIIQSGEEGHDSAEDALACIELMKWRLKEDLKGK